GGRQDSVPRRVERERDEGGGPVVVFVPAPHASDGAQAAVQPDRRRGTGGTAALAAPEQSPTPAPFRGETDRRRRRGAGGLPAADRTAKTDSDDERHRRGRLSGAGPLTAPESTFRTVAQPEPRNFQAGGAEGTPGAIRGSRGVLKPPLLLRSAHLSPSARERLPARLRGGDSQAGTSGMSNLGRDSIIVEERR